MSRGYPRLIPDAVEPEGKVASWIYRDLGGTGETVSAIGVGGWRLGLKYVDEPTALRIVRSALDRGINFLDNSWDYNDGASEVRIGKALRDGGGGGTRIPVRHGPDAAA